MGVFNFQTELLQSTLLGLKHFGCLAGGNWLHVVFSNSLAVIETLSGKKAITHVFNTGFVFFFFILCTVHSHEKNKTEKCRRASSSHSEGMFCFDHTTKT